MDGYRIKCILFGNFRILLHVLNIIFSPNYHRLCVKLIHFLTTYPARSNSTLWKAKNLVYFINSFKSLTKVTPMYVNLQQKNVRISLPKHFSKYSLKTYRKSNILCFNFFYMQIFIPLFVYDHLTNIVCLFMFSKFIAIFSTCLKFSF